MLHRRHKSILVLEDDAIIALDLEDTIARAEFRVASVISSCADTLEWLKRNTADIAIIDVLLRDGPCVEVAETLVAKSIPFVVFSGRVSLEEVDPVFLKGTWLQKPAASHQVVAALLSLSGDEGSVDPDASRQSPSTVLPDPDRRCSTSTA
jgi:ActR/RegA family two-component response regulator